MQEFFKGYPIYLSFVFESDDVNFDFDTISNVNFYAVKSTTKVKIECTSLGGGVFSGAILDTSTMLVGTYSIQVDAIIDTISTPSIKSSFILSEGLKNVVG